MNVSELTGAALDWAVTRLELERLRASGQQVKPWVAREIDVGHRFDPYSSDWMFGGPIIERERICVGWAHARHIAESSSQATAQYFEAPHAALQTHRQFGATPLVAAMRCYVAAKLGDEIDIPEELA